MKANMMKMSRFVVDVPEGGHVIEKINHLDKVVYSRLSASNKPLRFSGKYL